MILHIQTACGKFLSSQTAKIDCIMIPETRLPDYPTFSQSPPAWWTSIYRFQNFTHLVIEWNQGAADPRKSISGSGICNILHLFPEIWRVLPTAPGQKQTDSA